MAATISRFIFCMLASVHAVQYFISSSTGSDANSGRSSDAAWASFHHIAGSSPDTPLQAGDIVLLATGDTFILDAPLNFINLAGTAAAPILFSSYVLGTQLERPSLARAPAAKSVVSGFQPNGAAGIRASGARGPVVLFNSSQGVFINGWEISGGEQGVVFFYPNATESYTDFSITDCYFHDIRGVDYDPNTGSWWGCAIAFASAAGPMTPVFNVTIAHNLANNSDTFYINSVPWNETTRARVSGINVDSNIVTAMSYNTLFMDSTDTFHVTRNLFLHDTPIDLFVAGTTDIIMGTLNSSCFIRGNEIGWRGEYPAGPDGCAIDFETQADGVQVVDNYIHHAWGSGIMVLGHSTTSTNLLIADNIMLYNGCNQTRTDHGGIAFMHLNSTGTVSGNLFATCAGTPVFFEAIPGSTDGFIFINNTINSETTPVVAAYEPVLSFAFDSNSQSLLFNSSCSNNGCNLVYTTDGSRPTLASTPWPVDGLTLPARTTGLAVKAFAPGLVESATAGGVFSPPLPSPPIHG
jgi:hypothetical protein